VFLTTCSRCHVLKRGDWPGAKVNLVELEPSFAVVVEKVTQGGVAMPSFRRTLSKEQIRNVAAFVARAAARRANAPP
jgi:mono/diheme cytochrome c family protein